MCLHDQRNTCRASRVTWHLSTIRNTMAFLPVLEISDIISTIVFVMITSRLSDLLAHQPVESPQVQIYSQLWPVLILHLVLIKHPGLSESFIALTRSPLKNFTLPFTMSCLFICQISEAWNHHITVCSYYFIILLLQSWFIQIHKTNEWQRWGTDMVFKPPAAIGKCSSWKCFLTLSYEPKHNLNRLEPTFSHG